MPRFTRDYIGGPDILVWPTPAEAAERRRELNMAGTRWHRTPLFPFDSAFMAGYIRKRFLCHHESEESEWKSSSPTNSEKSAT